MTYQLRVYRGNGVTTVTRLLRRVEGRIDLDNVIGLEKAPQIIWQAKETDRRTKTPFDIVAPAALVSLVVQDNNGKEHNIQVDVPPLDFLEFRAHLPLTTQIGRDLLVRTTVQETMVAIAIRHVEINTPEGNKAMVQPASVRDPEGDLVAWKTAFDRAHEYIIRTTNEE